MKSVLNPCECCSERGLCLYYRAGKQLKPFATPRLQHSIHKLTTIVFTHKFFFYLNKTFFSDNELHCRAVILSAELWRT